MTLNHVQERLISELMDYAKINFLETEGFIEMTEDEAKKYAPGYLWELMDRLGISGLLYRK